MGRSCCSNDTCTLDHEQPKTALCPVNGKRYARVHFKTVMHQVKQPWRRQLPDQAYYFCTDPQCEVVYFGADDSVLRRGDVRDEIGQKSGSGDRTVCYCFDIRWRDIQSDPQKCKEYVVAQTKQGQCDCEIRNPSGKCCLKDFP